MFARACAVVAVMVVLLCGAVAGPASATPAFKLYVSMATTIDASGAANIDVLAYSVDPSTFDPSPDTIQLDVARAGAPQATASGPGLAQLAGQPLLPGDAVTVTDVATNEQHTVTYSGQPTLELGALCTGGKFSGTRDEGTTVAVSATSASATAAAVKVATGPGTTFAGGFTKDLSSAWRVTASETVVSTPAFSAFANVSRPALDCPPPPAPPPPAVPDADPAPAPAPPPAVTTPAPVTPSKDRVAPLGSLLKLRVAGARRALLGGTFSDALTITEPGTVTQVLYLDDRAKAAKATILGTGRAVAGKAGKVTVKVKLSKKGKAHVKTRKTVRVKLVTTVVDRAGNARVLAPKRFTVKHSK